MLKKMKLVFSVVLCLFCAACSNSQKLDYSQEFFTAFNHLLEADTFYADGSVDAGTINGQFQIYIDQRDGFLCALIINPNTASETSFYVKEGKTYLNYLGTKSQSVAENIGITDDFKLSIYNPFLDLTDAQRADLFDSIEKDGNEYTFQIDKHDLASYLDGYGSVSITKALMKAEIADGSLKNISLDIAGKIKMDALSSDLKISLALNNIEVNQPILVPYPSDLESW